MRMIRPLTLCGQLSRISQAVALLLLLLQATLLSQEAFAQGRALTAGQQRAIDRAVQAEIQSQQLVGVAVGVLRDREIVYVQGYGLSDRAQQLPVSQQTVFNWASNSKPVIAVMAMQLVEQGQLDLDQDIRSYVPEIPEKSASVTTRQLLCHQSGFPHYKNGKIVPLPSSVNRPADAALDPVRSLDRFAASPLIFTPGERYDYSSYGYVALSAVVQRAGERPLEQQVQRRIKQPLGLTSFQLDRPHVDQAHWTLSYRRNGLGQISQVRDIAHDWKHGAGGYKSNVVDFARWARALLRGDLLQEPSQRTMWVDQATKSGRQTGYGLGFSVEGSGPNLKVSHNGSQTETRTRMVIYPAQGHGVVVMCNTYHANPGQISTAVYRALQD